MLLGAFSTYTELTARVDKDVRHWQNDFYVQDNWRATSRLTLDYGVRFQHSGSDYEVNNNHTGFFADHWQASQAGRVYRLTCATPGVAGNQPCSAANQRSIDPANPTVFLPAALTGNIVPGTGTITNGISTDGIPGGEGRHILQVPVPRRGAQVRDRVERHGRWQDRDSRVHRASSTTSRGRQGPGATASPAAVRCRAATRSGMRRSTPSPRRDRAAGRRFCRRHRTRTSPATISRSRSPTTATSRSSATSASTPRRKSRGSATTSTRAAAPSMSTGSRCMCTGTRRTS